MELVKLGTMPLDDAKNLQRALATKGVEAVMNHNSQTCTRGCQVTVEVLIPETSLSLVQETLREQYQRLTQGLDIKWDLLGEVFDPSKGEATCPACGTHFQTSAAECPECGLCF
jgi:hypothetical protein